MVVTTENKKKSKGFLSGLNQLRVGDYKIAVTEIKAALGINNRNSFYAYRDGKIEPKVTQAKAVEGVFSTVRVEINRMSATSFLEAPHASKCATSVSRLLSSTFSFIRPKC